MLRYSLCSDNWWIDNLIWFWLDLNIIVCTPSQFALSYYIAACIITCSPNNNKWPTTHQYQTVVPSPQTFPPRVGSIVNYYNSYEILPMGNHGGVKSCVRVFGSRLWGRNCRIGCRDGRGVGRWGRRVRLVSCCHHCLKRQQRERRRRRLVPPWLVGDSNSMHR